MRINERPGTDHWPEDQWEDYKKTAPNGAQLRMDGQTDMATLWLISVILWRQFPKWYVCSNTVLAPSLPDISTPPRIYSEDSAYFMALVALMGPGLHQQSDVRETVLDGLQGKFHQITKVNITHCTFFTCIFASLKLLCHIICFLLLLNLHLSSTL